MRTLLGIIVVVIVGVVALGFYLGWFQFSTSESGNQSNFQITVDKERMREDEKKAKEKAEEIKDKAKQKVHELTK